MWKYIGDGRTITGVPAEDLTDEEFAAAEARLDAQFGVTGSLSGCQHPEEEREPGHACLLYQHVADKPPSAKAAKTAGDAGGEAGSGAHGGASGEEG